MTDSKTTKRIEYSPIFTTRIAQVPTEIKIAFRDALELFKEDKDHPMLRPHSLTRNYQDYTSIDVTEDYRALYREERERIIFVDIGTHNELYG